MNATDPVSCSLTTVGDGKSREALLADLASQLTAHRWSSAEIFGVQMAVEEAVSNAFQHGNQQGKRGSVQMQWEVSSTSFQIEVRDQGDGFDPGDLPDPTDPENVENLSGRGLLLMNNYMCEVNHREGGRLVVMRKSKASVSVD